LTFLAPGWLWLWPVAAAGVVLIHWLSRRRRRVVVFPAAHLIPADVAPATTQRRLRRWLLLVVRFLILAAVIGAFARPQWQRPATQGTEAGPGAVALLVDRSASMRRAVDGQRLFEIARQRALTRLRSLQGANRPVSVILVDETPRPLLPEPTRNVAALIDRLRDSSVTFQRGRLNAALDAALTLHESGRPDGYRAPVTVELYSDGQATHWPGARLTRLQREGVAVRDRRVAGGKGNTAVADLRLRPAAPVRGQNVQVTVKVTHYGATPVELNVALEGRSLAEQPQRQRAALQPGEAKTLSWSVRFASRGPTVIQAALRDHSDALDGDDRIGRALQVLKAQPVVLVTRRDSEVPANASYYVKRALQAEGGGAAGTLALEVRRPQALAKVLADAPVTQAMRTGSDAAMRNHGASQPIVVLVEAGRLNEVARQALAAHTRAGGGVLWWLDDAAAANAFNAWRDALSRSDAEALPRAVWRSGKPVSLDWARFARPPLAVFEGAGRAALLDRTFEGYAALRGGRSSSALLRGQGGEVVFSGHGVGRGQLMVGGLNLSPGASEFAKTPWFVMLLHETLNALMPAPPDSSGVLPGQALPFALRAGERVIGPDGEAIDASQQMIALQPGLYRLQNEAEETTAQHWVNFPPSEHDPAAAPLFDPTDRDQGSVRTVASEPDATRQRGNASNDGRETSATSMALWPMCAAAALALVIMELWLAGLGGWRPRRGSEA
jgi:hypothetical protein